MKRLVLLCLLCSTRVALATGGCDDSPEEQYLDHPDDLPAYAAGKLGLVRQSFPRMYLARAYLAFTGGELDAATQKQLVELWTRRYGGSGPSWAGQEAWDQTRKSLGAGPTTSGPGTDETFCNDDAFATAAKTATRLKAALSAPELKAWLAAQDTVFANCTSRQPTIPEPLAKTAAPLARAERSYQIAAATFYGAKYQEAATLFTKIGKDNASPWASWGDYLAARALLRDAAIPSAGEGDPSGTRWNGEGLTKARALLETIAKTQPERARAARALLDFIRVRQTPAEHIQRMAAILRKGGEDYPRAVADWTTALDHMMGQVNAVDVPIGVTADDLPRLRQKDELTDWVLTFAAPAPQYGDDTPRANGTEAFAHAYERYKAKRSLPWLIASLASVFRNAAEVPELLKAAAAVPRTSPAYDTVTFFVLGLLAERPHPDRTAIARRLDEELAARAAQPHTSFYNWLLDERSAYARSVDDLLDHAVRSPVGSNDECGLPGEVIGDHRGDHERPRIAQQIDQAIQRDVPWNKLEPLAQNPHTPPLLRARLLRMAFVRAMILGATNAEAQTLADRLLAEVRKEPRELVRPGLSGVAITALDALARATEPAEKRLQSALALVYGARDIDPGSLDGALTCPGVVEENPPPRPQFAQGYDKLFGAADAKARDKEQAAMKANGSAFDVGVSWLLAYAKDHPTDPRLVQPLYDINQISRRLRGSCHSSKWSKAAYLAMHKLFPGNPLTRKVGYWY